MRALVLLACCAATARGDLTLRSGAAASDGELATMAAAMRADTPGGDVLLLRLADRAITRAENEARAGGGRVKLDAPIALLERLLERYPTSTVRDGAYYLLGYCNDAVGRPARARAAWQALVKLPSKYAAEGWLRLGELEFDDGKLDAAITAYGHALGEPRFHDQALYKLAWAYYRAERIAEAMARFDEVAARAPAPGAPDLRDEGVQYVAICLSDAPDGAARADRFYRGREAEPHVRGVYWRLAQVYADSGQLDDAKRVTARIRAAWPGSPEAARAAALDERLARTTRPR